MGFVDMRASTAMIVEICSLEAGIVPVERRVSGRLIRLTREELRQILQNMSSEERRVVTRKFRKVWRKEMKTRRREARGARQKRAAASLSQILMDTFLDKTSGRHVPTFGAKIERQALALKAMRRRAEEVLSTPG